MVGLHGDERRFLANTEWGDPPEFNPSLGPCLMYIGADNGNGYKQFRQFGKNGYAHRYAWIRKHGPIPDGLTVDHLCRVRGCCNVEHFELVGRFENFMRGVEARTHCVNGHEYNFINTEYRKGGRRCLICRKDASIRSDARRRRLENGLPDRRLKYDQDDLARLVQQVAAGEMSVASAAENLGCGAKYMDKRVRMHRGIVRPRTSHA